MAAKIDLELHTVVLLVGPTNSGKTTWANILTNRIKAIDPNLRCPIVSLDATSQQQFDVPVTSDAFKHVIKELEEKVAFPNANEFVLVDTSGMDAQSRSEIAQVARDNLYNVAIVVFEYQPPEHIKGIEQGDRLHQITRSAAYYRKKVFPTIIRKQYDKYFQMRDKSDRYFNHISLTIPEYNVWKNCQLDATKDVVFIGDIHEHVDALKEMLTKLPENIQIVLLGDYLDKGNKTEEIIPLIEELVAKGAKVIIGNHESYIARRLKGKLGSADNEEIFFTSLTTLMNNPELASRFLAIYDQSIPFAYYSNEKTSAYATHAPCEVKYLGKMSSPAKKEQRNFFILNRSNSQMSEALEFMREETPDSYPLHIFGHVANNMSKLQDNKKVWLDTGAVYGNKLSAFVLKTDGSSEFIHVPCFKLTAGKLFDFVPENEKKANKKAKM